MVGPKPTLVFIVYSSVITMGGGIQILFWLTHTKSPFLMRANEV